MKDNMKKFFNVTLSPALLAQLCVFLPFPFQSFSVAYMLSRALLEDSGPRDLGLVLTNSMAVSSLGSRRPSAGLASSVG